MNRLSIVMIVLLLALSAPLIAQGIVNLKTFIELTVLLDRCDGAGSPGCSDK